MNVALTVAMVSHHHSHGQIHGTARVHSAHTEFGNRGDRIAVDILRQWNNPNKTERNIVWTRDLDRALSLQVDESVYVNALGAEGIDRVRAAFGAIDASLTPPLIDSLLMLNTS